MATGFAGVQLATSLGAEGEGLDAPAFEGFWATAAELEALVFVHPSQARPDPRYDTHYLRNLAGNPSEVGLAAAGLIFGGVLERWPSLRIVLSHAGGSVIALVGRWDRGASVRSALVGRLSASPSELAGLLHFDTIAHDPLVLELIARRWGSERLVVGTDRPFPMGDQSPLKTLHAAGFSPAAIDTITRDNPLRLLGSPVIDGAH
jgi:aminocarboxymuconate-semialdehyde decarboxylase